MLAMNIHCPRCNKKLAENFDRVMHVKKRSYEIFFDGKEKVSFICECGYFGTYDATGHVWAVDMAVI